VGIPPVGALPTIFGLLLRMNSWLDSQMHFVYVRILIEGEKTDKIRKILTGTKENIWCYAKHKYLINKWQEFVYFCVVLQKLFNMKQAG